MKKYMLLATLAIFGSSINATTTLASCIKTNATNPYYPYPDYDCLQTYCKNSQPNSCTPTSPTPIQNICCLTSSLKTFKSSCTYVPEIGDKFKKTYLSVYFAANLTGNAKLFMASLGALLKVKLNCANSLLGKMSAATPPSGASKTKQNTDPSLQGMCKPVDYPGLPGVYVNCQNNSAYNKKGCLKLTKDINRISNSVGILYYAFWAYMQEAYAFISDVDGYLHSHNGEALNPMFTGPDGYYEKNFKNKSYSDYKHLCASAPTHTKTVNGQQVGTNQFSGTGAPHSCTPAGSLASELGSSSPQFDSVSAANQTIQSCKSTSCPLLEKGSITNAQGIISQGWKPKFFTDSRAANYCQIVPMFPGQPQLKNLQHISMPSACQVNAFSSTIISYVLTTIANKTSNRVTSLKSACVQSLGGNASITTQTNLDKITTQFEKWTKMVLVAGKKIQKFDHRFQIANYAIMGGFGLLMIYQFYKAGKFAKLIKAVKGLFSSADDTEPSVSSIMGQIGGGDTSSTAASQAGTETQGSTGSSTGSSTGGDLADITASDGINAGSDTVASVTAAVTETTEGAVEGLGDVVADAGGDALSTGAEAGVAVVEGAS